MSDEVQVFRGKNDRWWWHVRAANGRSISASGQGFRTKWGAKRAARRTHPGLPIKEA